METDLTALLKDVCTRAYPDVAPPNAQKPYIVWQVLGGEALRYGDNTAPDKRNALVQISAWAPTALEALNMIHAIEDAICESAAWQAKPQGEARSTYEPDTKLYGRQQRFDIWATR